MPPSNVLGIDVAKDTFDVVLLVAEQLSRAQFANTPDGFERLSQWLQRRTPTPVWACLEATGHYSDALALYLHAQQHTVSVVNPARIKAYAHSQLQRNKTDQLDADLIARFCRSEQPAPWSPPPPEIRQLQAFVRQYDDLQALLLQARNRLAAAPTAPLVREQLEAQVQFLKQQLDALTDAIDRHLQNHPDLKQAHAQLRTIPGIGLTTAAKILAVQPQRFDSADALAAYAGVTPLNRRSGTSVHGRPRFCKIGDADLRRALYMPALVAIRHNPILRPFYERLCANGKTKMAAVGAVMHKLLRIAYGVLKSGKPFDPKYIRMAAC